MSTLKSEWLSLAGAAELLGVHPTTIRRWADSGKLPVHVTPGGHRRFLRKELVAQTGLDNAVDNFTTERVWNDYALVETRERLINRPEPSWLAAFSPDHREEKRELGRRLMSIIMQHISAPDEAQSLLVEARSIAVRYAQNSEQAGLTAAEGLEATAFFRDAMTEVALQMPQVAQLETDAQLRLLRKINQVFNVFQVALVDYYDRCNGKNT
ncbi:MAG TPA: helix-turn-helix domain-containing protein [Aggregatilinea sp.]|uniref:MerR family transcriptional regulator n=1 Tax=Aggregatilinea sp. TaxID=2806333 RepID=UPI002CE05CE3|nr:helix-turn-helix domain-containing protein [Aggregatilinea sp.]HML22335.1 helix-turn-helix domain-containing protein [Aggregatilinea sp.]